MQIYIVKPMSLSPSALLFVEFTHLTTLIFNLLFFNSCVQLRQISFHFAIWTVNNRSYQTISNAVNFSIFVFAPHMVPITFPCKKVAMTIRSIQFPTYTYISLCFVRAIQVFGSCIVSRT